MKRLRILPEIWARTLCWLPSSTRNMVPASTEVILPSVSIVSSTAISRDTAAPRGGAIGAAKAAPEVCEQAFEEALRARHTPDEGLTASPVPGELQGLYANYGK